MLLMPDGSGTEESYGTSEVAGFVRRYYAALERSAPLAGFYARDEEAGTLGPVVKIGSGKDEEFTGFAAVQRAVDQVSGGFRRNRLESRALAVHRRDDLAWFSDLVWWSGEQLKSGCAGAGEPGYKPFASLTRWTGICLNTPAGWKFLQVHVSEGV
jgi:hypothetical protein